MNWLLHRIAHLFSLNACRQVSGTDERGWWIGGQCVTCGKVHPDTKWYPPMCQEEPR
jgi:hypothetical protein